MSHRTSRLLAVACVSVATAATVGGRRWAHASPDLSPPLRSLRIERPDRFWLERGYGRLVAPIRPPTSVDGKTRIVEYVWTPPGARVSARRVAGRVSLRFPPGTVADRVEYVGAGDLDSAPAEDWYVADVRGTTLGEGVQEFHVYRPTGALATTPLAGIAWPRGDADAQERATVSLGALLENGTLRGPRDPGERALAAAHLRGLNDCAGCHALDAPPAIQASRTRPVRRGTDAQGFFQPSTTFDDRAPLETYRPRDANADDPFVRIVCGPDEAPATRTASGHAQCAGGEVPVGVLDVRRALRAGDAHAGAVCASRRWVFERLDDESRSLVADAMAACASPSPRP